MYHEVFSGIRASAVGLTAEGLLADFLPGASRAMRNRFQSATKC